MRQNRLIHVAIPLDIWTSGSLFCGVARHLSMSVHVKLGQHSLNHIFSACYPTFSGVKRSLCIVLCNTLLIIV